MRNKDLFTSVDASVQQISTYVNFDQRVQWKLIIESTGLDGVPQLFIEEAFTGSVCILPTDWTVYKNPCTANGEFDITADIVTIEKNDFKGNWFRLRVEPNGNTTGMITTKLHYKTFT